MNHSFALRRLENVKIALEDVKIAFSRRQQTRNSVAASVYLLAIEVREASSVVIEAVAATPRFF